MTATCGNCCRRWNSATRHSSRQQRRYQPLGAQGSRPERSLGHPEFELIDLFGNGLPTVVEVNEQVRYWRNRGEGRFDRVRTMPTAPAGVRLSEPGVQLLDADGNGRADLMVSEGLRSGYYPLNSAGQWHERGFVRYRGAPAINLDAADVRLLDLDGDGVTDALRTGPQFELYYNDAEEGWSSVELRDRIDDEAFPNVSFDDPRIKLADFTGDGLQDIVRVHDGWFEYWPYRGYGRWGRRVVMRNAPRFEDAAFFPGVGFDPRRLLVGDVDGDGVADLVYVSSGHISVWINQHGNALERSHRHSRHAAGFRRDGRAPRRHARHRHRGHSLDLRLRSVPGQHLQVPGPDRRDEAVSARSDGQPDGRGDQGRLRAIDAVLPGRRRGAPKRAGARRCPFPCRWWRGSRSSTGSHAARSRPSSGITTAIGTGWSANSAASAWSNSSTPRRSRMVATAGLMAPTRGVEPVPEKHFSPPLLSRTWFHQGAVDDDSGDWQEPDWSAEYWPGDPPVLAQTQTRSTVPAEAARSARSA